MSDLEAAARIIDAMADSIESAGDQFHYEIHSVGMTVEASGPGSVGALNAPTVTGGSGDVIGFQVSTNVGEIAIAQRDVAGAHQSEIVQDLRGIAEELRDDESEPSVESLALRLRSLMAHVAPPLVIAVAANVITHVAGVHVLPSI